MFPVSLWLISLCLCLAYAAPRGLESDIVKCLPLILIMMTSSNGNIFHVTDPFVRGIHRSPVNSPHKGQWHGAFMFSLICAWINGWVNNSEPGDLRRHRAHYDVTVEYLGDSDLFTSHANWNDTMISILDNAKTSAMFLHIWFKDVISLFMHWNNTTTHAIMNIFAAKRFFEPKASNKRRVIMKFHPLMY